MKTRSHSDLPTVLLAALLPGSGHLALGEPRRGIRLMVAAFLAVLILCLRWSAFFNALSSTWVDCCAAMFLVVVLAACVGFSIWDVRRLACGMNQVTVPQHSLQTLAESFSANRMAVASLYIIIALCCVGVLAPILAPYDPNDIDDVLHTRFLAPSWAHPFGTDEFGRDLLSRTIYGARVSLSVGTLSVAVATVVGTMYGAVAGYFGGRIDNVLMRIVDGIMAFPTLFLMLMLAAVFDTNVVFLVLILGFTAWPGTARYIRGEVLSLKQRGFTEAARALGLPNHSIILRHLVPNAMSPVLVSAMLMVGTMISAESALSFLGIGIRPPTASWGNMVGGGKDSLFIAWWITFFPGATLSITVICFNLVADGLRDALDPKSQTQRSLLR